VKCNMLFPLLALAACSQMPGASSPAPSTSASTAAAAGAQPAIEPGVLSQYDWQLSDAFDSKGMRIDTLFVSAEKPVQLEFSADRLNVVNSCNNMGASYSVKKGRLQIGQMVSTMMACPDAARAALDDAIAQRLHGSLGVSLLARGNAPRMQLVTDSGDTLTFTGVPTAQTRYGGPGVTAFLEVSAQAVPCQHPLIPDKQCLLVRERHFDEQGLPTGTPGEWQPLYQDIEGYTHTPGMREVLRVKRYTIKNPPADGPSTAYVLDLVVESEQVKN
jgi:heat shock protein HslJ